MRVLLVEDEPVLRGLIQGVLQEEGHEVAAADSVRVAIDIASRAGFDMVLCDEGLPDGSGRNLLLHLRAERGCDLRTVLMTGDLFHAAGDDHAVLLKPFRFAKLLDVIAADEMLA